MTGICQGTASKAHNLHHKLSEFPIRFIKLWAVSHFGAAAIKEVAHWLNLNLVDSCDVDQDDLSTGYGSDAPAAGLLEMYAAAVVLYLAAVYSLLSNILQRSQQTSLTCSQFETQQYTLYTIQNSLTSWSAAKPVANHICYWTVFNSLYWTV